VGEPVTLSLRPERVMIGEVGNGCVNRFDARVEELIYYGDHIRVRLSFAGHEDFIVKVPNGGDYSGVRERETIQVGWHVEDCQALDAPA